uniref:right-handed parallel beta-helix repeat-containing protein n=1 Tax=Candidatus Electronema sp. TaxID=2698783 RepID=UPI0040565000
MINGIGWEGPWDSGREISGFAAGSTEIRFTDISGWQTPANTTVNVVADEIVEKTVTYTKNSPETGKLKVTIYPSEAVSAGAQWRIKPAGSTSFQGPYDSGETVSNLEPGTASIRFTSVTGWTAPADKSVMVVAGDTPKTTSGLYTENGSGTETGKIYVTINPPEAVAAGAKWEAMPEGGDWQGPFESGQSGCEFPAGSVTIRYKDISGWTKPAGRTVTVSPNLTTSTSGSYTQDSPATGSVRVTISPADAVAAGAKWKIKPAGSTSFQGPYSSGDTANNLAPGSAVVQFVDVTGWVTPAEKTVPVVAGDMATASGEYTQQLEEPDVCIGHDYEQQTPLAGVNVPTIEISGSSTVNEQGQGSFSASSTVDSAKGGRPFYYWCAEKGLLQADPAHPDYSHVKFIAPKVAGADEDIRIYAKVGDTLGYVGRDIFHVKVSEIGNYNASDPAPTVSVTLPDALYAGRPFRLLYKIVDALFAARAAQMRAMAADAAAADEPAADLYTDIYTSTDGGDFVQAATGLRGAEGAYTLIPPSVTDNFTVKVVVTDGNSTVQQIIQAPAVQPWYAISGYCTNGASGEPIPNCLVQAAEGGKELSDYTGGFELAGLAEGSFTVSASQEDYYFVPRKTTVTLSKEHSQEDVSFTGYPLTDEDNDGLPDFWEQQYFGDLSRDGSGDFDQDGLSDLDEFYQGTDPTNADSDADGIPDGWEVLHGLDPLTDDAGEDPDNDGFSNYDEYMADTDPHDASSHPVVCQIRVPSDYATIQAAIDAAAARDKGAAVCVSPGSYEENLDLRDKVWLVAESKDPAATVIQGDGKKDVITMNHVDSGGVVGFTISSTGKGKKDKTQADGIVFAGASQRAVIGRNIIIGTRNAVILRGNVSPLIINNTVVSNQSDGIEVSGNSPAQVRNNIVADNGGYGIVRNGHAIDEIAYNDAFGNSKADYRKTEMGEGGLSIGPMFADGWHLGEGSPCIGAGRTLGGEVTDMGAYGGNTAALVYSGYVPGPPDSDADGISDAWELRYFGNLAAASADSDHDGDGYSDYVEYRNSVNGVLDPDSAGFDPLAGNAPGGEGWVAGEEAAAGKALPGVYELLLNGDR